MTPTEHKQCESEATAAQANLDHAWAAATPFLGRMVDLHSSFERNLLSQPPEDKGTLRAVKLIRSSLGLVIAELSIRRARQILLEDAQCNSNP